MHHVPILSIPQRLLKEKVMVRRFCLHCASLLAAIALSAVVTAVLTWSPLARADGPINHPECDCGIDDNMRSCPTSHGTSSCDINAPDCSVCVCVQNNGIDPLDPDQYICVIQQDPIGP